MPTNGLADLFTDAFRAIHQVGLKDDAGGIAATNCGPFQKISLAPNVAKTLNTVGKLNCRRF